MRWVPFCFWLCFGDVALFAQGQADLILTKAKFWTASASLPSVEAIAIKGDRIAAVGSEAEVLKWRGEKTILLELPRRLVVPGFIDNHTHFLELIDAVTPKTPVFLRNGSALGESKPRMPSGRCSTTVRA